MRKRLAPPAAEDAPRPTLWSTERVILELLVSRGEMTVDDLVGASNGDLRRGDVLLALRRMKDKCVVRQRRKEGRQHYTATAHAARVLQAWEKFGNAPENGGAGASEPGAVDESRPAELSDDDLWTAWLAADAGLLRASGRAQRQTAEARRAALWREIESRDPTLAAR